MNIAYALQFFAQEKFCIFLECFGCDFSEDRLSCQTSFSVLCHLRLQFVLFFVASALGVKMLYINPITSRGDMGSRWVCGHFYIHIKYHKQPCTSIMSWSEWYSAGPNIFRAFPTARNPSSGVKDRYEWSIANAVTFAEIILRFSKDIKDCGQYIELMWAMAIPVNGNTSEVKLFRKWKKHLWTKCPV